MESVAETMLTGPIARILTVIVVVLPWSLRWARRQFRPAKQTETGEVASFMMLQECLWERTRSLIPT